MIKSSIRSRIGQYSFPHIFYLDEKEIEICDCYHIASTGFVHYPLVITSKHLLEEFLVILKPQLKNYQKIFKKCLLRITSIVMSSVSTYLPPPQQCVTHCSERVNKLHITKYIFATYFVFSSFHSNTKYIASHNTYLKTSSNLSI